MNRYKYLFGSVFVATFFLFGVPFLAFKGVNSRVGHVVENFGVNSAQAETKEYTLQIAQTSNNNQTTIYPLPYKYWITQKIKTTATTTNISKISIWSTGGMANMDLCIKSNISATSTPCLYSQIVSAGGSYSWQDFYLNPDWQVATSTFYYLFFSPRDTTYFSWGHTNTNPYPNGTRMTWNNTSKAYIATSIIDMNFKIYMNTYTPPPEATSTIAVDILNNANNQTINVIILGMVLIASIAVASIVIL